DVAVIGLPDDASGERACAVVTTAGDTPITFEEMRDYLIRANLSKHKVPEQLELVDVLPRNPTGKVLKKDLRIQFGGES
ncbi:MAG TPA: cyclohexanecarboxylate-CoA ligase, partial [Ilumatobacteraceae bacterium]|nr:cyclohexanecarboxylate-CoA ligase [Ilumatobacteraceae bacterium]